MSYKYVISGDEDEEKKVPQLSYETTKPKRNIKMSDKLMNSRSPCLRFSHLEYLIMTNEINTRFSVNQVTFCSIIWRNSSSNRSQSQTGRSEFTSHQSQILEKDY